ncbi:thioredoxin-disulfide reductase [Candidatus Magnetobacterium bavaricum]|uniref:Thioredoxin-disulfide reductase n=1 Tax=Candidatus Magnetobacterium bavaricum TaxID=29290 RepID=A0A0F3GYA2_9BACT|nr:thioredoxin-disulfide reductase [Candidatus Magnetobacterium bavaricum]
MDEQNVYDIVIIGGGPAGLSAAQYAARMGMKTIVLDKSPLAGALASSGKIENYPGVLEPMTGLQLLDLFKRQAIAFGAQYVETLVLGVKFATDIKEVYAMDGNYLARAVIVATGAMGRKPSVKGEKDFLGRGVSYCAVCDAAFYKGKVVSLVGESEEAVKEASVLARFADKVHFIAPTNNTELQRHPTLAQDNISVLLNMRVAEIRGSDVVEAIVLENKGDKTEVIVPTDGVFMYLHGNRPIVDFLDFVVDISDEECVITNRMMETNIEGVFAAGDVTCVEVRQVVVSAAHGCVAALSAEKYVHHRKKRRLEWG